MWLKNYLSTSLDRSKTPWVIVMFNVPMYTSNNATMFEGELMRQALEPILHEYGVDFVVNGHVFAYERSVPVFNYKADPCGTTHVTVGDAGNYYGANPSFRSTSVNGTQTFLENGGWSAFREASFGVGSIKIHNATHAYLSWNRHACDNVDATNLGLYGGADATNNYAMNFSAATCTTAGDNGMFAMTTSDASWVIKPSFKECANKYLSTVATGMPSSFPTIAPTAEITEHLSFWITIWIWIKFIFGFSK